MAGDRRRGVNSALVDAVRDLPHHTAHDLSATYPDFQIDTDTEARPGNASLTFRPWRTSSNWLVSCLSESQKKIQPLTAAPAQKSIGRPIRPHRPRLCWSRCCRLKRHAWKRPARLIAAPFAGAWTNALLGLSRPRSGTSASSGKVSARFRKPANKLDDPHAAYGQMRGVRTGYGSIHSRSRGVGLHRTPERSGTESSSTNQAIKLVPQSTTGDGTPIEPRNWDTPVETGTGSGPAGDGPLRLYMRASTAAAIGASRCEFRARSGA